VVAFRAASRRRRDRFLSSRAAIPDREFIEVLGIGPADGSVAVLVRRAIAEMCEVPHEKLHATDETKELSRLMFFCDGWDPTEFELCLSFQLGVELRLSLNALRKLPPFGARMRCGFRHKEAQRLGPWVLEVCDFLRQQCPDSLGKPSKKAATELWDDWVP
jgi:hypothetical protein